MKLQQVRAGYIGLNSRLKTPGCFSEQTGFDMIGVMIDSSRNGVIHPEASQSFLMRLALMGVNMAILYTEDTYEIPGEPFFGYLRGRYTASELRAIDDYAFLFGIGSRMLMTAPKVPRGGKEGMKKGKDAATLCFLAMK